MIYTTNYKKCLTPLSLPGTYLKLTTFDNFPLYISSEPTSTNNPATLIRYGLTGANISPVWRYSPNPLPTPGTTAPATGSLSGQAGVLFGTGTTPETENDITLESPINDANFSSSNTRFYKIEDGILYLINKVVYTNSGSSSVTFQEVGAFFGLQRGWPNTYGGSGYSGNYWHPILIARHVFAQPITVAVGDAVQIVYSTKVTLGDTTLYPDVSERTY